jgi:YegS/Rv2252/BmrU family lipid kinase
LRPVTNRFLAIVNPAAGGGRCERLAKAALKRVRNAGIELDVASTNHVGEATELARSAYQQGVRQFLAVGGDGTAFEIVNGLFPEALSNGRPSLGFLPLGTGNSFLKDFTTRGVEHTIEALKNGSRRACDVIRLRHSGGDLYYLNLLSLGFPADVGELVNRRFKRWGQFGYIAGVFVRLAGLEHSTFPHRIDHFGHSEQSGQSGEWDRRPALFLSFNNSKFTGGKMMIAPNAEATDGQIEYVRWGPISRLGLVKMLPRLFSGTHINDPRASRSATKKIELQLDRPVNVMIDGEIMRLQCRSLEILPSTLDAIV